MELLSFLASDPILLLKFCSSIALSERSRLMIARQSVVIAIRIHDWDERTVKKEWVKSTVLEIVLSKNQRYYCIFKWITVFRST